MPENGERPDSVERLGAVETGLNEVRAEVGGLRGEVGGLRRKVNGLRVLGEKNAEDIKKIAEVQSHHGDKLDAIVKALEPLGDLYDFIRRVAPNHELRIQALEKHTGMPR
jgi:hypothetical protein